MSTGNQDSAPSKIDREFEIFAQRLDLEVDFVSQSLHGTTELQILPTSKDLIYIPLNCRQCVVKRVQVENKAASFEYHDPFQNAKPRPFDEIEQHHLLRGRLEPLLQDDASSELIITIPKSVKIRQFDSDSDALLQQTASEVPKDDGDPTAVAQTPVLPSAIDQPSDFALLTINITFALHHIQEGLHFVGTSASDARFPHVFTRNDGRPRVACCIFPCVDDIRARCQWDINITCARTLGEAMQDGQTHAFQSPAPMSGSSTKQQISSNTTEQQDQGFSEEELALDMVVVCSGAMTDEVADASIGTRKRVSFSCESPLSANQVGFAIGPFENVELSEYRELDEDDKLGSNAARVHAFCLPGRADEVRNTCMPMAKAIDFFTTTFTTYPFSSYKMCFLEDLEHDTAVASCLSFCSTRLLFPEDIIDPIRDVTRKLVHTLACQYSGVSFVANDPEDEWVLYGIAYYMTDLFLKLLMGNNEYRYQQKLAADRVCDLDIRRPSLLKLGTMLHLDPSLEELLALKAGVVLFILDRRLTKTSGSAGVARIISRVMTNAKSEDRAAYLSTAQFQRTCEKLGHMRLDGFFNQWVYGAGCPIFEVKQRFNKKKLVVEMSIAQVQKEEAYQKRGLNLKPENFLRDVNEDAERVIATDPRPTFSGPMTIRIHEADGTPYEHIVDIKESPMKLEIPYNTKYKRLKRGRRQKDRTGTGANVDTAGDTQDDSLLYCLGDVLQAPEDMAAWRLHDWPPNVEELMSQESYEWIRMDADFEWICKLQINLEPYMFVSQLQQDRDVVAQYESIQWLASREPHWMIPTFLTRTIMDQRYFHGIRTAAALGLAKSATPELEWAGQFHLEKVFQELFCVGKSPMPRSNDFSDRAAYLLQCTIPQAIARIRTASGVPPESVKRFFVDKLKFNDNTSNEFSDCYYVSTLMSCMTDTMVASYGSSQVSIADEEGEAQASIFNREALSEMERLRRIDEWIPSYHNIYTTTALDCLLRLAKANVIKPKLADFAQYSKAGNADVLRLASLRCLVQLDLFRNDAVVKYILHILSTDHSPFMRQGIHKILWHGLGVLAIGVEEAKKSVRPNSSGLVIEGEAVTAAANEDRAQAAARQIDINKALEALKQRLGERKALREALWSAVKSAYLSPVETLQLVDICAMFYKPQDSLRIQVRLPLYWRCEHTGHGKLLFRRQRKEILKCPTCEREAKEKARREKEKKEREAGPGFSKILKLPKPTAQSQSQTLTLPKLSTLSKTQPRTSIATQNNPTTGVVTAPVSTPKISLKQNTFPPAPKAPKAPKEIPKIKTETETPVSATAKAKPKPSPQTPVAAKPKSLILKLTIGANKLPLASPRPARTSTPIKSEPDSALSPLGTAGLSDLMSPPPRPSSAGSTVSKRPASSRSSNGRGKGSITGTPRPASRQRGSVSKGGSKSKSSTPQLGTGARQSSVSVTNEESLNDNLNGAAADSSSTAKKRKSQTPAQEPAAPPLKKQSTATLKLKLNLNKIPSQNSTSA